MSFPGLELPRSLAAGGLRVWLIVGILLRVTRLRDGWDFLAPVFYSTPWPVIAAGLAVLAAHCRRRGKGHAFRRYLVLTGGALFTWVATSWYSAPAPDRAADLRMIHWNVSRPDSLLRAKAAWLRGRQPDLICLAEVEPRDQRTLDRWRAEFPEYELQTVRGNMACLVRGQFIRSEVGELAPGSFYALHRLRVRGRALAVLQVDLNARPFRSRREPLRKLRELAQTHAATGLIIAGDFNTPRESVHLQPLRKDFVQSFEAGGNGIAETWPVPLLALSLDQIWLSVPLRAIHCQHPWTWLSDHRPVIVDLALD
ncbi:MAG TPA: endonuclease/exonuclease/phosphatase family protein [Chthoniobacteraceae bacterium]